VLRYVAGRIAQGVVVVLGAITISFFLANLTGNAIDAIGINLGAEARERLIEEYGFDRPVLERFAEYFLGALQGDFGESFRAPVPALERVAEALPYTATLVFLAIVAACAAAVPTAIYSVLNRDSRTDRTIRRSFMLVQGLPEFFIGLVLILVFAVVLGWLPSFGVDGPTGYVLPVIALALPLLSTLTRLIRSQLIDVMGMEFVVALRAKGLRSRQIVLRHALKNALPPLITYLALQLGWLLGGTFIVEVVFGIPGIGQLAVSATEARDLSVIQAIVVVVAAAYVIFNLLADMAVYAIDPRVRTAAR
jgi:peptide/nickel transport system permease protein